MYYFMSKDMKRVKRLLLGFEATCQAPDKYFGTNLMLTGLPAIPIRLIWHGRNDGDAGHAFLRKQLIVSANHAV